ncbi:MAG: dihydropteroate synthase [Gemmataceae bacterium]
MAWSWQLRGCTLTTARPALVMGIVNVTPDSFSDGGSHYAPDLAVAHALELVRQGADLLDIGGESSRPGASSISTEEELRRVLPVVEALAVQTQVVLSVDTVKAEVAEQVLSAGAHAINDITAMTGDPAMAGVIARHRAGVVLMHMQGTPQTMQVNPTYQDVVQEVCDHLQTRLQASVDQGIAESQVVLDPGIGFGKTLEHNLQLLAKIDRLGRLGRPICLGVSRKGFLGKVLGRDVQQRLAGSLAVASYAILRHQPLILRVHDVEATCDTVRILETLGEREETPSR